MSGALVGIETNLGYVFNDSEGVFMDDCVMNSIVGNKDLEETCTLNIVLIFTLWESCVVAS